MFFCRQIFNHHLNKEVLKLQVVLNYSYQFLVQEDGETPHTDLSSIKHTAFK